MVAGPASVLCSLLTLCVCSVVDGQCSADGCCLADWLRCLGSDVRRSGACVSSIELEKTSCMVLFCSYSHVCGRYAAFACSSSLYVYVCSLGVL